MQQLLTNLKTRQSLHTYLGLEKNPKNVNNMINYKLKFFVNSNCKKKKIIEKYNNPIIEIMLNTINLIPVKKNRYTHKIMFYIKFTIDLEKYPTL